MSGPRTKWAVVAMTPRTSDRYLERIQTFGPFVSRAKAEQWLNERQELRWNYITRVVSLVPS